MAAALAPHPSLRATFSPRSGEKEKNIVSPRSGEKEKNIVSPRSREKENNIKADGGDTRAVGRR
jgi:hypothetical protein